MQLYEAGLGRSITWNPPSMSAILRWLGPGPVGASRMVELNSFTIYLSLGLAGAILLVHRARFIADKNVIAPVTANLTALLLVALVLVNPILLMYVGIVWKDVLFGSFMLAGAALGLIAMSRSGWTMWTFAVLSAVVLGIGLKVRQQGIFMAPVLLLIPMLAVSWQRGLPKAAQSLRAGGIVLAFAGAVLGMGLAVSKTISTPKEFGDNVGYRGIMMYDVVGILVRSPTPSADLPIPVPDEMRDAARSVYSPDRGDYLTLRPDLLDWLMAGGDDALRERWKKLVTAEYQAYARHKLGTWQAVLNVDGVAACLPVHVGIDGENNHLRELGFVPGVDKRDQAIFNYSRVILQWPIYRHWVYLLTLVAGCLVLPFVRMPPRLKLGTLVLSMAAGLMYLSFLPASVACDFRYLFPALTLVSLQWITIVTSVTGFQNPLRVYRMRKSSRAGSA